MNKKLANTSVYTIAIITFFTSIGGGMIGAQLIRQPSSPLSINTKQVEKTVYIEESAIIDTAEKVSPAVVSIVITKDLPLYRQRSFDFDSFFFGGPRGFQQYERDSNGEVQRTPRKVGGGSGFTVSEDGLMLTNRHVVDDPEADYTVILNDGRELPLEVISRDPLNDIAVAQIKTETGENASNLPVARLGDSDQLKVGQRVVAIGNALAEYGNSVTTGVISAKNRNITAGGSGKSENLINLLQTDTAINPGNSGGPLTNLAGQVIGVNVAIANGAEGIGFAIPMNDVKPIIESVKKNGRIIRPFIGVRYILLNKNIANELNLNISEGAYINGSDKEGDFAIIPGSPAEKADLKTGDVILEVDGIKISTSFDLRNIVSTKTVGDEIELNVWRSGETFTTSLTLEELE